MRKSILLFTIATILSLPAYAGEFSINYKNLNTLASLICQEIKPEATNNTVLVNKFTTNKTKYGADKSEAQFELTGICNSRVSKKTSEILSFGEEIQFTIDLKKPSLVLGTIGINELKIVFKENVLKSIIINKIFENKKLNFKIPQTRWATSDSLFSFNKNEQIKIEKRGRVLASEKESNLYLNTGEVLYNIWNYQAFGCHTTHNISQSQCEAFTNNI
ncbi:MAG: hypothetical protein ACJAS4_002944 [Bacteriovoracaceae bacterium]|jgi:hypothetical protein